MRMKLKLNKQTRYIAQHLSATNDRNGNPQRCFVVYKKGDLMQQKYPVVYGVIDEGYSGMKFAKGRKISFLNSVNVSVSEYKETLCMYKEIENA